jgi:GT2 family glycosyltransferase
MRNGLISVIIVNWNGEKNLQYCLSSLARIDYSPYEIILVDNGSTDDSVEFVRKNYPKAIIIKNKTNLGFAEGNNKGIKKAGGEYILFLNNDTKVEPNFLNSLVSELENDSMAAVVQSKILLMNNPKLLDSIGSFLTWSGFLTHFGYRQKDRKNLNNKREIFSAMGACMLFKKEVLNKIGLFDKDFFAYFEETDLCWRAWLAGYKILYIPKSVIYHQKGATALRLANSFVIYHSFKNRICSLIKNLEAKNLVWILSIHLVFCNLVILKYLLIKSEPQKSLAILRAFGWNISNFQNTLKKRNIVQNKTRKVPDKILLPQISRKVSLSHFWQIWKRID